MTAPVLVVAATSARMLAQSAGRGGFRPIALDLFGDLDTRRAAHWFGISHPHRKEIDAQRLEAALTRLARFPRVLGWVAGGGLENRLDVMEQCARALVLIGNGPATVAAIKDPASFFGLLDDSGIDHPEIRLCAPPTTPGWLSKRIGGTGGWHVRRVPDTPASPPAVDLLDGRHEQAGMDEAVGMDATSTDAASTEAASTDAASTDRRGVTDEQARLNKWAGMKRRLPTRPPPKTRYYQREMPGIPMSALFLSNGREVSVVGFNRLLVASIGDRPFVFQGAVGPVALPVRHAEAVRRAVSRIVGRAGLVGLNSLDFLLTDRGVSVLEVNPRPSATLDLHDDGRGGGLMNAHVAACTRGTLPDERNARMIPVRGLRVVYARSPLMATSASRTRLQGLGWCHDIASAGTRTESGEPLCTVSACGISEEAVVALLARRALDVERIHEEEDDK